MDIDELLTSTRSAAKTEDHELPSLLEASARDFAGAVAAIARDQSVTSHQRPLTVSARP